MNHYTFEQSVVGLEADFSVVLTQDMMDAFLAISGDCNPLHLDEKYARSHGMPSRVVYGLLTSSFYSTLAGVYLPGERCLLHGIEISFNRPTYVGDKLHIDGRIAERNETFRQVQIQSRIRNQDGKTVSKAKIKAGFLE